MATVSAINKNRTYKMLDGAIATGAGTNVFNMSTGGSRTFQADGTTSSGSGSATIKVQVSNDNSNWIDLGTVTLSLSTTSATDGFTSDAPWAFVRGNVTAISGTGASVNLYMGT